MALNPFVLLVWTAYTSDKVLVVAPIAGVLAALAADKVARGWAWTTLLASLGARSVRVGLFDEDARKQMDLF